MYPTSLQSCKVTNTFKLVEKVLIDILEYKVVKRDLSNILEFENTNTEFCHHLIFIDTNELVECVSDLNFKLAILDEERKSEIKKEQILIMLHEVFKYFIRKHNELI